MPITEAKFLPFNRAFIEEQDIEEVLEVLRSGWLTTGPRVKQFEAAFCEFTGAAHSVALSSCTAALHLALAAIGVTEGDEVIIPTMTFASTGETVLYFNARPVLVDCAPNSFHVDPRQVEAAITNRTKAIVPVHYSGFACDMDAILDVARTKGLKVIEDAAHALPSTYKGKTIGTLGDITCFSFYATKTLTTGEGGMVTTENEQYAERIRALSLHGISKDAWKRYSAEGSWRYDIQEIGYKYNLTDIQAALGLAQLAKREVALALRTQLAERYDRGLASLDAFETAHIPVHVTNAWHLYVLQVKPDVLRIGRDRVIEELKSRGIGTSVHFIPLHLHSLYQRLGYREGQFPHAEARFNGAISLPLYPGMTDEDSERVIAALHDIARDFHK
jgi:dTDP-4-amino-4,6-dideoxygalactose transaminase